ncbi:MAG: carboxylesterase family protein [Lachnospiraceae bacterium]|nr:carboxylesterase family protein [Lachnospiraceae bacterium]
MIVSTKYGRIEGTESDSCHIFKGIPYAAPPVGKLRFEKPENPLPWEGIYKADSFRCKSIQFENPMGGFYKKEFYSNPEFDVPVSEDCLYLNIWVPKGYTEKLPVAVYVHGGAFMSGAGSNLPFVCDNLAKEGVIVVTINYRLGALGFLCHPLFGKDGESAAGGNYGLWDIVAAIKWVKENIDKFGGDPCNISAFGQSAGAMSLQALAVSKELDGLVKRMILQSGGGYDNPLGRLKRAEDAKTFGDDLIESFGIDPERALKDEGSKIAALDKIKSASEDEVKEALLKAMGKSFEKRMGMPYAPVIDGKLLKEGIKESIDAGNVLDIEYILGSNGDDITAENTDKTPETNPMHRANVEYAKRMKKPSFVYYFDRKLPGDDAGAFHSAELWYVFGSLSYCWRPLDEHDEEISLGMIKCWSNFFKCGDPNGNDEKEWKRCTESDAFYKVFK